MTSDIARISFDASRGYRSVITQQGRVTLEADVNEAARIAEETLRREMIEIIGVAGTPDNGYAASAGANANDIVVGAGALYLSGWRLRLESPVHLNVQPDWANLPAGQPSWTNLPTPAQPRNNLAIALLVTEQEVGAIEDQALLEVALGGPDTAARSRLMQHFLAIPVAASTCAAAATELAADLTSNGLTWSQDSGDLASSATLQVSFFPPTTGSDPCTPTAAPGYLGADNQLVRVTVASFDPTTKTGTLLWGWNNASFLFRAVITVAQQPNATPPSMATMQLSPSPIDAAHTPQPGQVIEVLRTQCILGDAGDKNYVAASVGQLMTLPAAAASFDPDSNALVLPAPLPADYASEPNSLFMRLWQGLVPFTSGQAAQLDAVSGLAVTVTIAALPSGAFATAAPVWRFAVRPNTPQQVYATRFLRAPQKPDAPRQWLGGLAIVNTGSAGFKLLEDCRKSFQPLTKISSLTVPNALHVNNFSWTNDDVIALDSLYANGLTLTFNAAVATFDAASFIVEIETPTRPFEDNARATISTSADGVSRLVSVIDGVLTINGASVTWRMGLSGVLALWEAQGTYGLATLANLKIYMRARVTLKGRTIRDTAGQMYLDGQCFGTSATRGDGTARTDLVRPSGNNAKASDFESWFYIAPWPELSMTITPSAVAFVQSGLTLKLVDNTSGKPDPTSAAVVPTVALTLSYNALVDAKIAFSVSPSNPNILPAPSTATIPAGKRSPDQAVTLSVGNPGAGQVQTYALTATLNLASGEVVNQTAQITIAGAASPIIIRNPAPIPIPGGAT